MPNWEDDEGRFWYEPDGCDWWDSVPIPHPPVSPRDGCGCAFCADRRGAQQQTKKPKKRHWADLS